MIADYTGILLAGVEILRGDAADGSDQRARRDQRRDLQKRDEQGRATKVERLEISLRSEGVSRESCLLLEGRNCVIVVAEVIRTSHCFTTFFLFFCFTFIEAPSR